MCSSAAPTLQDKLSRIIGGDPVPAGAIPLWYMSKLTTLLSIIFLFCIVVPVELASNRSTTYAGQTATVMGWGDTNSLEGTLNCY